MRSAGKIKKKYLTYNKIKLALFSRSYVAYSIQSYIKTKYKINDNLTKYQLRQQFSSKRTIAEISRLSKVLNLNYQLLWQFVVLNKKLKLGLTLKIDKRIKVFLKLESEMIHLSITRLDKESTIKEDYEWAILAPAIERAAGNDLKNIKDDFVFNQRHMQLEREYTRLYYKVTHKYKLLTPGNRALILRLITKQHTCTSKKC